MQLRAEEELMGSKAGWVFVGFGGSTDFFSASKCPQMFPQNPGIGCFPRSFLSPPILTAAN